MEWILSKLLLYKTGTFEMDILKFIIPLFRCTINHRSNLELPPNFSRFCLFFLNVCFIKRFKLRITLLRVHKLSHNNYISEFLNINKPLYFSFYTFRKFHSLIETIPEQSERKKYTLTQKTRFFPSII
jgi:hypothetical protein